MDKAAVAVALSLVAIFCVEPLSATLVVVLRTPQRIVLGTDSLRTWAGRNGSTRSFRACKIQAIGSNQFAAAAGTVGDDATGYNLFTLIAAAAARGGSLAAKMARLDGTLVPALQEIASATDLKRAYVEVVFVGFEGGSPTMTNHDYRTKLDADGRPRIDIRSCPSCGDPTTTFLALGVNGKVNAAIVKTPERFGGIDVDIAERAIHIAMEEEPAKVGLPANILAVTPSRAEWLRGGEICEAQTGVRK